MKGVLDGVRVVELGQVLAGPFAGAIFADLGADVIKVEKPDGGDDARRMGPDFRHGDALNFHEFNRGKKSVTLDLKSPEGVEALHGLLAEADTMLHNLRPGAAEALGIGAQAVTARHPHLIYCEMSAFGHIGPERLRPGYEPLLQAFGGLSSITGEPDGPPVRMGASVVDQGTGLWTVLGALAMLERRHRTGQGGVVNTSLFETALLWAGQKISAYVNMGKLPERHASGHPNLTPYEAFDAADGPVLVCCGNDRLFAKFATELGHAERSFSSINPVTKRVQYVVHLSQLDKVVLDRSRRQKKQTWGTKRVFAQQFMKNQLVFCVLDVLRHVQLRLIHNHNAIIKKHVVELGLAVVDFVQCLCLCVFPFLARDLQSRRSNLFLDDLVKRAELHLHLALQTKSIRCNHQVIPPVCLQRNFRDDRNGTYPFRTTPVQLITDF